MFVFWGDGSKESMDLVRSVIVRSTENFNWTFIFILAVVFYVYWSEIQKKNYQFDNSYFYNFLFVCDCLTVSNILSASCFNKFGCLTYSNNFSLE